MNRWVLVADNSHARLLSYHYRGLDQIDEIDHPEGRLSNRHINSDGNGRTDRSSGRSTGSDWQPSRSAKDHITDQYVKHLCQRLDSAHKQGQFDELYVCAPPGLLGQLRTRMPRQLSQCVTREIAKDLVTASDDQLMNQLRPF